MPLSRPLAMLLCLFVLACRERTDEPPAAAPPPPRPPDTAIVAAKHGVPSDTSSPAYKQMNLMTAPIQTLELAARASDTLRWTAQSDSCGLIVASRRVPAQSPTPLHGAMLVAEWFGTGEFGDVWDIAPSPDWRWIAYGQARRIDKERDLDTAAADTKTRRAELLARIVRAPDGTRYLPIPVIEPLLDTCSGDECPLNAASPLLGGMRVGWNTAGTAALVSGAESPPHWTALSPDTREPTSDPVADTAVTRWVSRAIPDLANDPHVVSGGGAYRFESRHDSIFVTGPDRNSVETTRYVGAGIPLAATRNGQYVLSLRREGAEWRAVIYEFVLFHYMITSSCDRTDKQ